MINGGEIIGRKGENNYAFNDMKANLQIVEFQYIIILLVYILEDTLGMTLRAAKIVGMAYHDRSKLDH